MFEGGQAGEWRAKVSNAGVMLASVAPVTEFLTKAGQGQLATQCEHTEGKLFSLLLFCGLVIVFSTLKNAEC